MTRTTPLIALAILSCAALCGQDVCTYDELPVSCSSTDPKVCDDLEDARNARIAEACGWVTLADGPTTPTVATVEFPFSLCDGIEIRYKVEWASPADEYLEYGVMWRGLHAIHWNKQAAVGFARHLVSQGRQNVRSVRIWEEREVRLDCESTGEDTGSDIRKP